MRKLLIHIWKTNDVASGAFLLLITVVAAWVVALPFSSAVQDSYLKRFHLDSSSFTAWAVQQPVPAMYNFENRYWTGPQTLTPDELKQLEKIAAKLTDDVDERGQFIGIETNAINHFPSRSFTFAFTRQYLKHNPHRYFYLRSRYRDRVIQTSFKTVPVSDTEIRLERLESSID